MTTEAAQLILLVERLAQAEADLVAATAGKVDAVVHTTGQAYLLKEAQDALLRSEAFARDQAGLLSAIFEHAPDSLIYVGNDRRVRYANQNGTDLSGHDVIGEDWLTLQMPEHREALERIFETALATGEGASFDGPGLGRDGSVAYCSRRFGAVRRDGETVGVVIVTRDITKERAAEAQLMVSDRMASVGTLAAGVAHEINNPLAAVIANLDLAALDIKTLGQRTALPRDLEDEIADARLAVDRVRLIVRDLKIFSRAEEDTLEAVDVERVLESTLRMAWNEIRHRARLEKSYRRVPAVLANEARLGQLFLNLVVNAAQAIAEGNVAENVIRISTALDAEGRVLVTVSDTGPGIPPDVQKHLFTPFFTTKATGTGLGLSICQRIVASMKGEISFASEVGKGTEFRVFLPVARFDKAPLVQRTVGVPTAKRRGRILVVDDDVMFGTAAKRILEPDHDVVAVDSAARALDMFVQGDRFDVILCDLMMPQMTGRDLHTAVTRLDPAQAARFVFVTGGAFTLPAREFLASVTNHKIEKPFDVHALQAIVNGLID